MKKKAKSKMERRRRKKSRRGGRGGGGRGSSDEVVISIRETISSVILRKDDIDEAQNYIYTNIYKKRRK